MRIENEYNIEDVVFLKTDPDQLERIVTGITVRPGNTILYEVACETEETSHYGFEISRQKAL